MIGFVYRLRFQSANVVNQHGYLDKILGFTFRPV